MKLLSMFKQGMCVLLASLFVFLFALYPFNQNVTADAAELTTKKKKAKKRRSAAQVEHHTKGTWTPTNRSLQQSSPALQRIDTSTRKQKIAPRYHDRLTSLLNFASVPPRFVFNRIPQTSTVVASSTEHSTKAK